MPSCSRRWQVDQKLWHAVQKTDSVCFIAKIFKNHQIIFLIWIFLTVWYIQLWSYHLFWVFLFELQKYPEKIIYYLLVCFSQILPRFTFSQFCKSCACFFLAKTFWKSWETVTLVENLYFQQRQIILLWVLTTLISLWWVLYERSFQVCEGRWWKKIRECQKLKIGDAPVHPQEYPRRLKRLSLGMLSSENHGRCP